MTELEQKIRDFVLEELKPKLEILEISSDSIDDQFDLVDSGAIDSLGFIELVGAVESEFSFEMDFEELDPSEYTNFHGFVRCAAKNQATS